MNKKNYDILIAGSGLSAYAALKYLIDKKIHLLKKILVITGSYNKNNINFNDFTIKGIKENHRVIFNSRNLHEIDKKIIEYLNSRLISSLQFRRINDILNIIYPSIAQNREESVELDEEVDLEILKVFHNWKNSKIYK